MGFCISMIIRAHTSDLSNHGMAIANQDLVNAYGGGYNAWDVTKDDFLKFEKVEMIFHAISSVH